MAADLPPDVAALLVSYKELVTLSERRAQKAEEAKRFQHEQIMSLLSEKTQMRSEIERLGRELENIKALLSNHAVELQRLAKLHVRTVQIPFEGKVR